MVQQFTHVIAGPSQVANTLSFSGGGEFCTIFFSDMTPYCFVEGTNVTKVNTDSIFKVNLLPKELLYILLTSCALSQALFPYIAQSTALLHKPDCHIKVFA